MRSIRLIAVVVAVSYLALLVLGWLSNIPVGHEGILRVSPSPAFPGGMTIDGLASGSPLAQAGLQPGDTVLAVDGVPAIDDEAIHRLQHDRRAGQQMTVRVQRGAGVGPEALAFPPEDLTVTLVSQLALPDTVIHHLLASGVGLLIMGVALVVILNRPEDRAARLLLLFGGCFAFICAAEYSPSSIAASTAATMTPPRRSLRLAPLCAMR